MKKPTRNVMGRLIDRIKISENKEIDIYFKFKELSLRVEDATLNEFDKVLDSKYYTVESSSIIVKLKDCYLKTLKNGTYNIKVLTKDGGKATSSFVIANSSVKDEVNPKTGDGILISITIGSISLVGLLGTSLYLKKKRFN